MTEIFEVKIFNCKAVYTKGWIRFSVECQQWLEDNIGRECAGSLNEFKINPSFKWIVFLCWDEIYSDYFLTYFKNKDDALLFKLTWGGM